MINATKKIADWTYIILHIQRDLNLKHVLSEKPVLSTFKASRVHVLLVTFVLAERSFVKAD